MGSTLLVGVLVTSLTAFLFASVGVRTLRRQTAPEVRIANSAFAMWWFAAAAVIASLGLPNLLGLFGVFDDGLHSTILYARALPLAMALGSLMFYFVFLLTGRRRAWRPIALAYAAFYAYTIWMYAHMGPWVVDATAWDVRLVPQNGSWTDLPAAVFGVLLCVPMLLAGVGYLSLALGAHDPVVRYRIVLVAGGIVAWSVVLVVAFAFAWPSADWFALVYQPAGLAAGVLSALAFSPPAWILARLTTARAPDA